MVAALVATGCDGTGLATDITPRQPARALMGMSVITALRGLGAIGSGTPTYYGVDRQRFDFDAGIGAAGAYGRLDYVDSGFVKEDGQPPHFVVGPAWPGTGVGSFTQTSPTCAAFDGVGKLLNTGELLAFRIEACDNGQPGAAVDVFGIEVPQRLLTHGEIYRAGPLSLSAGEVVRSGSL
jgi:hypothetical protein